MPLYEYQCKQCGHRFEKIQSFSAPEIKECPVCGGETEKMISAPSFQFKGSGWYVSDYGKGGAAGSNTKPDNSKRSEGSSEGSSSKSDSGSGDSKSSGDTKSGVSSSSPDSGKSSSKASGGGSSSSPSPSSAASSSKKD